MIDWINHVSRLGCLWCPLDSNDRLMTVRTRIGEADEFVLSLSGPHIAAANQHAFEPAAEGSA